MKFTVDQTFSRPADVVAEAFRDPALYPWFAKLPKVQIPEVLDRRVLENGDVRLRIRYRFGGDLSAAARAVIDPQKLSWVDESIHRPDQTVRFTMHPDNYGSQFRCRGSYRFEDTADGCVRRAEVEVKVTFPLVGRAVEGAIASGLSEHLGDEVAVVEAYLAGRDR